MRGFSIVLVLLVLGGIWWWYSQVFALKRTFAQPFQQQIEKLPEAIARGPGVQFSPGSGALSFVAFTEAGAHMELDAGDGDTLARTTMRLYRERNGEVFEERVSADDLAQ